MEWDLAAPRGHRHEPPVPVQLQNVVTHITRGGQSPLRGVGASSARATHERWTPRPMVALTTSPEAPAASMPKGKSAKECDIEFRWPESADIIGETVGSGYIVADPIEKPDEETPGGRPKTLQVPPTRSAAQQLGGRG